MRYNHVFPNDENEKILLKRCLHRLRRGFIEIGEENFLMPQSYIGIADQIEEFEIRDSDIWIIAHPKSGNLEIYFNSLCFLILPSFDFPPIGRYRVGNQISKNKKRRVRLRARSEK